MTQFSKLLAVSTLLAPSILFAQIPGFPDTPGGGGGGRGIEGLIAKFGSIVGSLIPIVVGLALLVFFWGLVKFILASGSEDAKDQGKRIMIWGLIALFVMVSVWGLVSFIQNALLEGADFNAPPVPLPPQ